MIGATTSIGTLVIEFKHREFKITSVRSVKGEKIKPVKNVSYRLTHANVFELVDGQQEAKFLVAAVYQWPLWGCSKDFARKNAIKLAFDKLQNLSKEDRKKLWFAYLTRGTHPGFAPVPPEVAPSVVEVALPTTLVSKAWEVPQPSYVMEPAAHHDYWGV